MSEKLPQTLVDFVLTRIVGSKPSKSKQDVLLLNQKKPYFCGQTEDNDIICKNDRVAEKHCIFYCYPDDVHIQGLENKYGVYLNGKKLKLYALTKLKNNDLIGIGTSTQDSNDSSKTIFQLQKKVYVESKLGKRKAISKQNHPPSKSKTSLGTNSIQSRFSLSTDCKREERKILSKNGEFQSSIANSNLECAVFNSSNIEGTSIVDVSESDSSNITTTLHSITSEDDDIQFVAEVKRHKTTRIESNNKTINLAKETRGSQKEEGIEIQVQNNNIKNEKDSSKNDQAIISLFEPSESRVRFTTNKKKSVISNSSMTDVVANDSDSDDFVCLYLDGPDMVYPVSDNEEENKKDEKNFQNGDAIQELSISTNAKEGISNDK